MEKVRVDHLEAEERQTTEGMLSIIKNLSGVSRTTVTKTGLCTGLYSSITSLCGTLTKRSNDRRQIAMGSGTSKMRLHSSQVSALHFPRGLLCY